jgi:hypothetical protein
MFTFGAFVLVISPKLAGANSKYSPPPPITDENKLMFGVTEPPE